MFTLQTYINFYIIFSPCHPRTPHNCHPRTLLSGIQIIFSLDSRFRGNDLLSVIPKCGIFAHVLRNLLICILSSPNSTQLSSSNSTQLSSPNVFIGEPVFLFVKQTFLSVAVISNLIGDPDHFLSLQHSGFPFSWE